MAKHVRVNRIVLLEVVGGRRGRQRQYLHDHLPAVGVGGRSYDAHICDGIGPVRAWVWQMRPIRLLAPAVRHVRGEVAELALEHRARFFHELAVGQVVERLTRLTCSPREEAPPLLAAADHDLLVPGDSDKVKTRDKLLGDSFGGVPDATVRIVHVRLSEQVREALGPWVDVAAHGSTLSEQTA